MRSSAPSLRPLESLSPSVLRELPPLPREGAELFVITEEGTFGSTSFAVGDILVCRGKARTGDLTVLVARGHGRPRLGSVQGARIRGDAGEPCHPDRWRSAGAVVARYRREEHAWVIQMLERRTTSLFPPAPGADPSADTGADTADTSAAPAADASGSQGKRAAADKDAPRGPAQLPLFAA